MHPVEEDRYVIPTNALEAFVNIINTWIRSNVVGALVPGRQRIGKSWAVAYYIKNFRKWLGDSVGMVSAEVLPHKIITETLFWGDLLRTMGHPTTKRNPEDRRSLFIGRLVAAGARSAQKKVVIFLDEAQLLDDMLFKLLIGVHNEMWRVYHIKCAWILVGQPELETVAATYIAEGKRQIVGRFMSDTYVFQPLLGFDDFTYALECFDQLLRHPLNGPFFTEHYAPVAWAAGYRLKSDDQLIYERITNARQEMSLPESSGMTMQGFTTLMNHILTKQLPKLKAGDRLTKEMVDESIEQTNCMIFESQEALLSV
ncbi:MAG TPA: ATP-binding protein [Verrucomicrobiae bacterium]|nr:ATP-binding protein [Verrucomicrobiae bacterium]